MEVITLNDNNEITNILQGLPGGKMRKCILSAKNVERLSPIIRFAHKIGLNGNNVFIEVKFQSRYSQRSKRLEIVSQSGNNICVYKFSKKSSFERECLEVQRSIDELKEIFSSHSYHGVVILPDIKEDLDPFQRRVDEITTDVSIIKE